MIGADVVRQTGYDRSWRTYHDKQNYILILLACLLVLPAAVPSMADEVKAENARNCITTRRLKGTAVIDDRNILFFMIGKTVFHNILPKQCKGLTQSGTFLYHTTAGSLCNLDTIRLLAGNDGLDGKSCRLGYFLRITEADIPAIVAGPGSPPETAPLPPAEVEDIDVESDQPRGSTPH